MTAFVHIHTGSSTVRHSLVKQETMTNGESVPIGFIVLYIMRIFLFSHSRSCTLFFSRSPNTVGVSQVISETCVHDDRITNTSTAKRRYADIRHGQHALTERRTVSLKRISIRLRDHRIFMRYISLFFRVIIRTYDSV